ncbi:AMP-dependent synthetase [Bacillus sp. SA1-12]|uniref:long-chain-fatty-acid--CoA ligase n=1 Tax=Bacillus sp. SA1-12 TaxID=1455638 RepID=UPI0006256E84|nr:long-chain fatty acid--CoA ligase [Bacillus sp. SA1-12]KKI93886.1 AMP-dependent synthetase [Bacillus sp. SA1-12]
MKDPKHWMAKYPDYVQNEVEIPPISVPEMLQKTVDIFGEHEAVSFYGNTFTYNEIARLVVGFASSLQQAGVQKGDRVAIMLPNCPQYVVSYYGALTAGAIVTQLNPMLVERELEYVLNDCEAETIVLLNALYPRIKAIQIKTSIKNIITVSLQSTVKSQQEDDTFDSFLAKQNGLVLPIECEPEHDIAVLQYTGGTTGRAKGAMLTHRNIVANAVQTYKFFKDEIVKGHEKCLTVLPLFHVFGMSACMNLSIYCGNSMIMLPRFDLEEVLETIKREQPTLFPGVPTMYMAITSHPRAEEYGIDSIRICNSGSAPMPVELLREFESKTGAQILEGYGLSEASPSTHCNPAFAERKAGTVGIGLPGTEYKIVDVATGTLEVPTGRLGELIIRGPQVMKGYWNMIEETAVTLRDGWLFTGDIARMDKEGYVSIVDRKKDLIIASGYNVYPREIEEVLYEHPSVQEAVVIGIADDFRGETVKAFIVQRPGNTADPEEIISFCRQHLAAFKIPRIVEFREELPKTNVGKILRRILRDESAKKQ